MVKDLHSFSMFWFHLVTSICSWTLAPMLNGGLQDRNKDWTFYIYYVPILYYLPGDKHWQFPEQLCNHNVKNGADRILGSVVELLFYRATFAFDGTGSELSRSLAPTHQDEKETGVASSCTWLYSTDAYLLASSRCEYVKSGKHD